jgi:hypothetical protein
MLTLIATSAIGYFAYRLNTTQYYVKLKADTYMKIREKIIEETDKIKVQIRDSQKNMTINIRIPKMLNSLKEILDNYIKEFDHIMPELKEIVGKFKNNLDESNYFFRKGIIHAYDGEFGGIDENFSSRKFYNTVYRDKRLDFIGYVDDFLKELKDYFYYNK